MPIDPRMLAQLLAAPSESLFTPVKDGKRITSVPSVEEAQKLLEQLKQQGRGGYIDPYASDKASGVDVVHWPL